MRLLSLALILILCACAVPKKEPEPLALQKSSFRALPGWGQDDLIKAIPAFTRSCKRILKASAHKKFGPLDAAGTYSTWQPICRKFISLTSKAITSDILQHFFEEHFTVWSARAGKDSKGLFTGYYEASLRGSRKKYGPYSVPLYTRPDDLVMVNLGEFRDNLKGRRIAGRVHGGKLKPYESRTDIIAGDWPHNDQVLVWVDDPVDAFFVQIQGSGVIEMDDGSVIRIGYAGQNGHPYYAIGRELIKRKQLTQENVSMQSIRNWLETNPHQAHEIMNTNASYVFFRELEGAGPLGGEGVALTAGRSLAVDRSQVSYGLPVWVDLDPPKEGENHLQRLMIAQDTGGAIRGAVRGDVFWGFGARAEYLAGHMKSQGRYWFLLPKNTF